MKEFIRNLKVHTQRSRVQLFKGDTLAFVPGDIMFLLEGMCVGVTEKQRIPKDSTAMNNFTDMGKLNFKKKIILSVYSFILRSDFYSSFT